MRESIKNEILLPKSGLLASGRTLVLFQHKKEIHHLVEDMTMGKIIFSSSMAVNVFGD